MFCDDILQQLWSVERERAASQHLQLSNMNTLKSQAWERIIWNQEKYYSEKKNKRHLKRRIQWYLTFSVKQLQMWQNQQAVLHKF